MAIKYAPSAPNSSAAMASPMDCSTASAAERVCDWEEGVQCPNDRESDVFHTGNLCFSWRFATPAVSGADASHVLNAQKVGAEAQLDQAKAQKDRADADLQRTELRATVDGRVTKLTAAVGALAAPGQAIMIVVPLDIWVTANFKESQLADMGVGQPVDIRIDAFGGRKPPRRGQQRSGGQRNRVQSAAGRKRHRQLCESGAARAGEDYLQPASRRRTGTGHVIGEGRHEQTAATSDRESCGSRS